MKRILSRLIKKVFRKKGMTTDVDFVFSALHADISEEHKVKIMTIKDIMEKGEIIELEDGRWGVYRGGRGSQWRKR